MAMAATIAITNSTIEVMRDDGHGDNYADVDGLCHDCLLVQRHEDDGLVWLNTYAWPADIKRRAVQKLLQELPEGSQVVSYEPLPTEALSFQGRNLHLQTTVNLEASWDPDLTAQVYRLEEEKETDRPRFGRGFKFQSF
ncbi:unnamed protein product [Symbiodinium sp. CCMP2592]|nr:unnamed protein product [Symbiodinium sp. CCMP2592]